MLAFQPDHSDRLCCTSPRGDLIAFTKQGQSTLAIGVMGVEGRGERILTEGYYNEGPTVAPNGRVLMFFRDAGSNTGPSLYTIDITGRNGQMVPTPSYASDPAWSPLIGMKCDVDDYSIRLAEQAV